MLSNQILFFMHYWMNIYSYWSTHSTGHTNYDLWNVMTNYAIIIRCTQFTQSTLSLSFENWVHFCHSGAAYIVDTILENVTTCEITREMPSLLCMKIACSSVDQRRICGEKTVCSRVCNYIFNSKSDQERHDLTIHQAERKRESRKRGKTTDLDAAQVWITRGYKLSDVTKCDFAARTQYYLRVHREQKDNKIRRQKRLLSYRKEMNVKWELTFSPLKCAKHFPTREIY